MADPGPPRVSDPQERARLSRQAREILRLLEAGPCTNVELARVALKYTGRISEIRQAGYDVRCVSVNRSLGLTRYELVR